MDKVDSMTRMKEINPDVKVLLSKCEKGNLWSIAKCGLFDGNLLTYRGFTPYVILLLLGSFFRPVVCVIPASLRAGFLLRSC